MNALRKPFSHHHRRHCRHHHHQNVPIRHLFKISILLDSHNAHYCAEKKNSNSAWLSLVTFQKSLLHTQPHRDTPVVRSVSDNTQCAKTNTQNDCRTKTILFPKLLAYWFNLEMLFVLWNFYRFGPNETKAQHAHIHPPPWVATHSDNNFAFSAQSHFKYTYISHYFVAFMPEW